MAIAWLKFEVIKMPFHIFQCGLGERYVGMYTVVLSRLYLNGLHIESS